MDPVEPEIDPIHPLPIARIIEPDPDLRTKAQRACDKLSSCDSSWCGDISGCDIGCELPCELLELASGIDAGCF